MKKHLFIMSLILLTSCQVQRSVHVNHYGVLREIMRENKLNANIDLKDLANSDNLYALGAVEGLAGEILILNGNAYHSRVQNNDLTIKRGFDLQATLLVSSEVEAWTAMKLDLEWLDLAALQRHLKEAAKQKGIDTSEPFPFRIQGDFDQLGWHVINAPEAEEKNHDAYKASGLEGSESNISGEILGFYSEQHEGVFTHHGSYLHMHWLSEDKKLVAHIDELSHNGKITLLLPKR